MEKEAVNMVDVRPQNDIVMYKNKDKSVEIQVKTDGDTVWLNRNQMAELFGRDVKTIGKHINNALQEELVEIPTVANFATVGKEGSRQVTRNIDYYNIDMILSVGYRVKSSEGIHFRRWANSVLKKYLFDGVVVNPIRLEQLNKVVEILGRSSDEMVSSVVSLIESFTSGLDLLDNYDHNSFDKPTGSKGEKVLTYELARTAVDTMHFGDSSELFGNERGDSFKGILESIYQTFGGKELYASVQEKAANLLYMLVKDHPFSDGNKRIAAALFVYFLDLNRVLRRQNGDSIIDNNSLAAMTLMIALSRPEEKEIMCLLVMNMLDASEAGK
jgi:prophage maintenance system killer protein